MNRRRTRCGLLVLASVLALAAGPAWAAEPETPPLSPPAEARPPLPLPGETGSWRQPAGGPCDHPTEEQCTAARDCAWVKVYGTVPGAPALAFCHTRTPIAASPDGADTVLPAPR